MEEALDLSFDRLLMMMMIKKVEIPSVSETAEIKMNSVS